MHDMLAEPIATERTSERLSEGRLLEFGFVEGATIEVMHEGAIRRDPIAVRLDDMRIALRRRDAEDVWILLEPR